MRYEVEKKGTNAFTHINLKGLQIWESPNHIKNK